MSSSSEITETKVWLSSPVSLSITKDGSLLLKVNVKSLVSIVKYEKPGESVRKVVELAKGLENLPAKAKVFIKPNVVYWNRNCRFPKWHKTV